MTDEQLDDRVLLAVRAARPAPEGNELPSSHEARLVLERAIASGPGERGDSRKRGRLVGWAVPALAVLATVAVAVVALGALGHSHRSTVVPGGSGPAQRPPAGSRHPAGGSGPPETLSASQYAFAIGGDTSSRVSPTQASSGLRLFRADQVLRERCMSQRGFRYIPDPTPTPSQLPAVTGFPSTFYPQPLPSAYPEAALVALRQREGFGVESRPGNPDPDDAYLKTLSPAEQKLWRTAWMGHDGCYGVAMVQLFGSRHAADLEGQVPVQIYNYLNTVVYEPNGTVSPSNPRTAAAVTAWSRCMQTATGHAWADENALINTLGSDYSGPSARTLAVADAKCAYSSGQAQTFAAAFRQAATDLPSSIQTELRFLLAHRNAWINTADRILASPNP